MGQGLPDPSGNKRILIVDDNPAIHADFRKVLQGAGGRPSELAEAEAALFGDESSQAAVHNFELDSAHQGQEALEKVTQALRAGRPYALAFVDVRMPPGWDGIETVTRLWRVCPELQVVICTAYSDYSWDDMVQKLGSSDNLVILKKPFDTVEVLQLAHAFTRKWELNVQAQLKLGELTRMVAEHTRELEKSNDRLRLEVQERVEAEEELRRSEERFEQAFEASPIPLTIQTLDDLRYVSANQCFLSLTGYERDQVIGRSARALNIWGEGDTDSRIEEAIRSGKPLRNLECQFLTRTGELRQALVSSEILKLGSEPHLLMLAQDVTERVQLEGQFRQAQKMEAIGQLAAGVAHDFNNILTIIQGYATMLENRVGSDGADAKAVAAILSSTERASNLVRQLLMFGRKRIMQFQNVDLNETILSLSGMLRQLVGEHINIQTACAPDLPPIYADRGMIEQIVVNLAINARDAISSHGSILIRSSPVQWENVAARARGEVQPGEFVCLTVEDTGCGIPPELLPHLFEPFFTTKEVGKGTGLGLATVYGIVRQHQGWIDVSSSLGAGTSFRIYLPLSQRAAEPASHPASPPHPARHGSETILVAEDEPILREMVSDTLAMSGYRVLLADSGPDAMKIWQEEQGRIDLLLTDMVMPGGMMGTDLAAKLTESNPTLKVIFTTGYSPGATNSQTSLREGVNFISKPYSPRKLAELVRSCLDAQATAQPA